MKSLILKADILSPQHKVTFRGETSVKTYCGVLGTLIVAAITIVATVFFSKEIFVRDAPISRSISRESEDSTIMIEDYPLIMTFLKNKSEFITHQIQDDFIITALLNRVDMAETKPISNFVLKVEPCRDEFFLSSQELLYPDNEIRNLCINPNEIYDFAGNRLPGKPSLIGNLGEHNSQSISISIFRKPNFSKEAFKKKYGTLDLSLSVADRFVDVENYDNPIETRFFSELTTIDLSLVKTTYLEASKNTLRTDSGVFFENYGETEYLTVKRVKGTYSMSEGSTKVSEILFSSSSFANFQSREYLKMQTVFAQVGGIAKGATIIVKMIVELVSQYTFYSKNAYRVGKKQSNNRELNNSSTELNQIRNQSREDDLKPILSLWKFLFWKKESFDKYFVPKKNLDELFDVDRINKLLDEAGSKASEENVVKPEVIARQR